MLGNIETININENAKAEETKKYVFRKLKASDIGLMTSLIKKIGINKISKILKGEDVKSIMNSTKHDAEDNNSMMLFGATIVTELVQVIVDGYEDYENDLHKLLSNTSNLSLEEVQNLDFDEFFEMLFDFFKKEEFMGFLRRVLKLLGMTD